MGEGLIGRAKAVIVSHSGGKAQAVISSVIVTLRSDESTERIRFTGLVAVDEKTALHIRTTILSIVDTILTMLGRPLRNYDLSVADLWFASVAEVPLLVRGNSAGLPIFLALFSASTGIPISEEFLCTGHIAAGGDIVAVAGIPEKLDAAASDPSVSCFVCPDIEADGSLSALAPREKERIEDAVIRARETLRVKKVRNIAELLETVLDAESIALAALREGFYETPVPTESTSSCAGRIVQFLVRNNDKRFWTAFDGHLMKEETAEAKRLLLALVRYHIEKHSYPKNLGIYLLQRVAGLPPHVRRSKGLFPLFPVRQCLELGRLADDVDLEDVNRLYDAIRGKGISRSKREAPTQATAQGDPSDDLLNDILSRIEARALSEEVGQRIDAARASFLLEHVTADSDEEFHETIAAYYIHLLRSSGFVMDVNPEAAADEAYSLLSRAFSRQGGPQAALAEGRCGVRGGMRFVLDVMTEEWKREEETKHIARILQEALLGPDKWKQRVGVAAALLRRLGPGFSRDIAEKTPEQCAHHIQDLIRVLASSMEQTRSLLRNL